MPLAKRPNISRLSNHRLNTKTQFIADADERQDVIDETKELEKENKEYIEKKSNFYFSHKVLFDDSGKNFAVPLQDGIFSVPKIGQYVIVLSEGNINLYVPSPLFENNSKIDAATNILENMVYEENLAREKKMKTALWPRAGSMQVKNENGKAYLQLDNNDFILATSYAPLEQEIDDKVNAQYHEANRFNPADKLSPFIFGSNFENISDVDEFINTNAIHDADLADDEEAEAINEEQVENLSKVNNFKKKINNLFQIELVPPANPLDGSSADEEEDTKQNGLLIAANDIYLTKPNLQDQEVFKAAKGESVIWMLEALISEVKVLKEEVATHKHLGTPSSVLDPIMTKVVATFDSNISKIEENLHTIKSKNVNIT